MTSMDSVEQVLNAGKDDRQRVSELHQLVVRARKAQRVQWQELRQNANRAVEQRNEAALSSQVSFLWGFLIGLNPSDLVLIETAQRFMRQPQQPMSRLVSELSRLDDMFKRI